MQNTFNNKVILIAGARGYIGSSLVEALKEFSAVIYRVSRDKNSLKKVREAKAKIIDITHEDIKKIVNIDIIFYLSAQTSTYKAQEDIYVDYNSSVKPLLELLALTKTYAKPPIFVFTSTSTICGLVNKLPVDEAFDDNPVTIYDIHKLVVEKYIYFFTINNFIRGTVLRLSNVYGPGVSSSADDRGILNLMIKKAINNENLTLYGDGKFIRDYIFIDDVINALMLSAHNIDKTIGKYYLVGSAIKTTILEAFNLIIECVKNKFGLEVSIITLQVPDNLSTIEYRNFVANIDKFKKDTNWNPFYNLEIGIKKTIDFYLKQKI